MAAGTAQVNALAEFLQEKEDDMKTIKPYFEGEGYNLDYTLPMHPTTTGDEFDYSKPVDFDYSSSNIEQSPSPLKRDGDYSPKPIEQSPIISMSMTLDPVVGSGEFFASM
jgi:hypothetical protein